MCPKLGSQLIFEGEKVELEFVGGVTVSGEIITGTRNLQGKIILITFQNCTVTYQDEVLFKPDWGLYHMAVGRKVSSGYNGPADLKSFNLVSHALSGTTVKKNRDDNKLALEEFYQRVRDYREGKNTIISRGKLFQEFISRFPKDWLLPVELYELAIKGNRTVLATEIKAHLEQLKLDRPKVGHLIDDGLALVDQGLKIDA